MNPKEIVAGYLKRMAAAMPAEIAAILSQAFERETKDPSLEPHVALARSVSALTKDHEYREGAWHKRETPSEEVSSDGRTYVCMGCDATQPECVCATCGAGGPPASCICCARTASRYACLGCGAAWRPVLLQDPLAGARCLSAVVEAKRSSGRVGYVTLIANSDVKDDHGTIIPASVIAPLITPKATGVDRMHECQQRSGVKLTGPAVAVKVPWVDKATGARSSVNAVKVEVSYDLDEPEAAQDYQDYLDCKLTGGSIWFNARSSNVKAVKEGKTDLLDKIVSVPWMSQVEDPSNPLALAQEMRSKRATGETETKTPPAPADAKKDDKPTKQAPPAEIDPMEALRRAVDDTGDEAPTTPPGDAPAPDAKPDDGKAPEEVTPPADDPLAAIGSRLTALEATMEQMRSSPLSKELEAAIVELKAELGTIKDSLSTLSTESRSSVEKQGKLNSELMGLTTKGIAAMNAKIKSLTAIPKREGFGGPADPNEHGQRSELSSTPEEVELKTYHKAVDQVASLMGSMHRS